MSLAASFGTTGFARFINSPTGRVLRIAVGLSVIGYGFTQRGTQMGTVLMAVGVVPLLAGAFDLCLVSGLLGGPFRGSDVRRPPTS